MFKTGQGSLLALSLEMPANRVVRSERRVVLETDAAALPREGRLKMIRRVTDAGSPKTKLQAKPNHPYGGIGGAAVPRRWDARAVQPV